MNKMNYAIRKSMDQKNGKKIHVLLNNEQSEVWETADRNHADEFAKVLNENSDSGHHYSVVEIGKIHD